MNNWRSSLKIVTLSLCILNHRTISQRRRMNSLINYWRRSLKIMQNLSLWRKINNLINYWRSCLNIMQTISLWRRMNNLINYWRDSLKTMTLSLYILSQRTISLSQRMNSLINYWRSSIKIMINYMLDGIPYLCTCNFTVCLSLFHVLWAGGINHNKLFVLVLDNRSSCA